MFKSNLIISLDGLYKTQADIIANSFKKHPIMVSKDVRVITENGESTVHVCIHNPLTLVRLFKLICSGAIGALVFVWKLGYEAEDTSEFFEQHLEIYDSWEELE